MEKRDSLARDIGREHREESARPFHVPDRRLDLEQHSLRKRKPDEAASLVGPSQRRLLPAEQVPQGTRHLNEAGSFGQPTVQLFVIVFFQHWKNSASKPRPSLSSITSNAA